MRSSLLQAMALMAPDAASLSDEERSTLAQLLQWVRHETAGRRNFELVQVRYLLLNFAVDSISNRILPRKQQWENHERKKRLLRNCHTWKLGDNCKSVKQPGKTAS